MSNDNPYSEAHFKTLKYCPSYPGRFRDIDHARAWTSGFIVDYKLRPHEGLPYHTPTDVFEGRTETAYAQRQAALDAYYAKHPERFSNGPPLAKQPPAQVCINLNDGITTSTKVMTQDDADGEYAFVLVVTLEKMK